MKVTVSSKGQIVIPASVRAKHGMEAGQEWVLVDMGTHLALAKRSDDPIGDACGMFARPDGRSWSDELVAERRLELEGEERRLGPRRDT